MLRTFLIRNGVSVVFKDANKPCYLSLRQMSTLGTSAVNQDTVQKDEGLIVFFLGMPGCGKRSLCKELQNAPDGLGDGRPVRYLTGGLTVIGEYWQKVALERGRNPDSLILADKNATTEVLPAIEDICRNTKAAAIPIIPYSRGTESNPFCLDALAVFMYRVLQRVNHPEGLDKNSPIAGYVMLSFYCRHEGMRRKALEGALLKRFGSLVKMPLMKADRGPLPDDVRSVLEDGLKLYEHEKVRQGRWGLTKSSCEEEWANWEKQLREAIFSNAGYLHSIQVPFESAVKQVLEQLSLIARGENELAPSGNPRFFGNNNHLAELNLLNADIQRLLVNLAPKHPKIDLICKERDMKRHQQRFADIILASITDHGITSVAGYRDIVLRNVPVEFTALFFNDKMAALEAKIGSVDGKKIDSRYQWPHVKIWSGDGASYQVANTDDLPQLHSEGKATRIEINPPVTVPARVHFLGQSFIHWPSQFWPLF